MPGADHAGHASGLLGGVLSLAGPGPRLRHAVPATAARCPLPLPLPLPA